MSRLLKVYGWTGYDGTGRGQRRMIVAAHSFAEFRRTVNVALGHSPTRDYVTETSNELELEIALAEPLVIFSGPDLKTSFERVGG